MQHILIAEDNPDLSSILKDNRGGELRQYVRLATNWKLAEKMEGTTYE